MHKRLRVHSNIKSEDLLLKQNVGDFATKDFFGAIFLATMKFFISIFLFRYFRLFYISLRSETVLVVVAPSFFLCLGIEPLKPYDRSLQNVWGQYLPRNTDAVTHNDSWVSPFPLHILFCKYCKNQQV